MGQGAQDTAGAVQERVQDVTGELGQKALENKEAAVRKAREVEEDAHERAGTVGSRLGEKPSEAHHHHAEGDMHEGVEQEERQAQIPMQGQQAVGAGLAGQDKVGMGEKDKEGSSRAAHKVVGDWGQGLAEKEQRGSGEGEVGGRGQDARPVDEKIENRIE